jgi:hypothetical protein
MFVTLRQRNFAMLWLGGLMASDYASAVTGAVANVTCGAIVD